MEIRSFYKAFMTKKGDNEVMMKVDTSGDMFSPTVIDAIREMYTNGLNTQDFLEMAFARLFSTADTTEDGEAVEVPKPENTPDTYSNRITILKITPINQEQTDSAIIDGCLEKQMSCMVAIKNLTDGYQSAIMEYSMAHTEVVQYKGHTEWHLRKFFGTRTMDTDDPETWPETLDWTLPRKYRKVDADLSGSFTVF